MIIVFLFLLNFTGNQPTLVAKHLTKLFDSMAKIKMQDATRFHRAFFYIAAISFVQHESCCNDRQGRWRSRILQGLPLRRPSMGILGLRVLTIAFWRLKSGWRPWCSQCGRQWGTLWCRFEVQLSSKLNLPTTLFRQWARMSRRRGRNGCSTTRPRFYPCIVTWETLMFRCPWQERKSGGLRRCSFQSHFCFLIFTFFHQHFHIKPHLQHPWARFAQRSHSWRRVSRTRWRITTRSRLLSSTTSSPCSWAIWAKETDRKLEYLKDLKRESAL